MVRVEIAFHNHSIAVVIYNSEKYIVKEEDLMNVDNNWSYGFIHPSKLQIHAPLTQ